MPDIFAGREREEMKRVIHVLNGPNLNLLGQREPEIYGHATLADVETMCRSEAAAAGFDLMFRQSNAEHELVDWLQKGRENAAGIIINPAAFSYSGYSIFDTLKLFECPVIEVHISNIHRRDEAWRANSIITAAATGIISGLGVNGYALAVRHIAWLSAKSEG
jgi:3-dehydroquinate dehydratase II